MILRLDYLRDFYAKHQTNFGQPEGTPRSAVREAALRELDGLIQQLRADAWDEGYGEGLVTIDEAHDNPYRASETA